MRRARTSRGGVGKRVERLGVGAFVLLVAIAPLLHAGCTDGVTPNCADPAIKCGPEIDAAGDQIEAARLPEATTRDTAPEAEAAADAPLDTLDAGDEG